MTPQERAGELFRIFMPSKILAIACVNQIIEVLDHFGYINMVYQDFEDLHLVDTDSKDPCDYWNEVKQILEAQQ